ncbi:AMP-dependent synthetase/ligase [Timonella sp. A28]|uniref:AMP-dependent synthetase/ligase n=1 Tax=Timonella sp. A28 TaxID=3442640 RepID=UPI003EBF1EF5
MDEIFTPPLVTVERTKNLNDLLAQRVTDAPSDTLMERQISPGNWEKISAADFNKEVETVAKGIIASGINVGDRVGIMSRTSYEWSLLDWAIWAAGAVSVPLYETSSSEQVEWIVNDSHVQLLFAENEDIEAVVNEAQPSAPSLREVLVIANGALAELAKRGTEVPDEELAARRQAATLDSLATIIYTSGTTGRPKGTELAHENFYVLSENASERMREVLNYGSRRTLMFMPLAHVFARFIHVLVVPAGSVLGHVSHLPDLLPSLATFKPSYLLSVPRVFEKVYNSSEQKAVAAGKGKIFHWAARVSISYSRALDDPKGPKFSIAFQHKVADALVLKKIRAALGGDTKYAISGGAALGDRLGHFFRGVGLVVLEGYGLTETTAPTSVNTPENIKIGTVGPPLPGCGIRIADDGEILVKGPHVFKGYHNNPQATADAFDGEWFKTGDLGSLDDEGYLKITGRKKEIIVTAGGKNVAPAVLEDRVRSHPLVSQVVVVGDAQPFIGALLTIDAEALPAWLSARGKPVLTVAQAKTDPDVLAALQQAVNRANKAVSRAESIREFTILDDDFTIENGYLTPSMKVKRSLVLTDYSDAIAGLYKDVQRIS